MNQSLPDMNPNEMLLDITVSKMIKKKKDTEAHPHPPLIRMPVLLLQ
jgi:hypothetical protein